MAKVFNDEMLVAEYAKCRRCRVVAEKFGCSDETVRRALIKANVPRIIRHPRKETKKKATEEELRAIVSEYYTDNITINGLVKKHKRSQATISNAIKKYGHGVKQYAINCKKVSDEELIEETKTLSCRDIAIKHGMSEERVWRRARKLGIDVSADYSGGRYRARAARYGCAVFDETVTLVGLIERDNGICKICGLPIDGNDIKNGHIGRMYPTIDHIIPLSRGGEHSWKNVQLAHMHCNAGKCDRIE